MFDWSRVMSIETVIQGRFDFGDKSPDTPDVPRHSSQAPEFRRGAVHHLLIGATPIKKYLHEAGQDWVLDLKELVMETDLSLFYSAYQRTGRKAIHPGLMISLIVYGLLKGIKSLRALEQLSKLDIGSWWLTDGLQPDHSTIGKFIQLHGQLLQDDYFTALTRVILQKLKVNTQEVACDGTIVDSVGSRYKEMRKEAIIEAMEQASDEKEKERLSHALQVSEERGKKRQQRGKKGGVKICVTDSDAVYQRGKIVGSRASYKPSVLATKDRIITGMSVHPSSENAVIPDLLHQHKTITGKTPQTLMGDAGYCTLDNIALGEKIGLNFLSPSGKDGNPRKGTTNDFHKSKFTYDASNDIMICPAGRIMTVQERNKDRHGKSFVQYRCHDLANCPYADLCTRSKKARTVKRYVGDDAKTRHLAKMEQESSKKLFSQRQAMVEPVFSELKGFFNLRRFTRYGLKGASIEMALFGIAYNLKRYLRLKERPCVDAKAPAMAVNGSENAGLMTILLNYMFLRLNFRKKTIFTKRCCQISFFSVV